MVSIAQNYIELHARSAFSFLRGACSPENYADRCATLNQPGMALLDFDGFYGAPRFHGAMRKQKIHPYLGAEIACTDEARYQAVIELGKSLEMPLVATNSSCYAIPQQRELLDVFTCLHHKTTLAKAGRLLAYNSERYLKSTQDMVRLFSDVPEAIANTLQVASQLRFTLADLGYEFPHYPVPEGESEASFLRKRTEEGARLRYGNNYEHARPQLERELVLIEKLGFAGYFLIVWDIVRYCEDRGILIQGRGSAANSAKKRSNTSTSAMASWALP